MPFSPSCEYAFSYTFAVAGVVGEGLEGVEEGGEGGGGGDELQVEGVAPGHQQLRQGEAHLPNIQLVTY